jgi:hypothetical protein
MMDYTDHTDEELGERVRALLDELHDHREFVLQIRRQLIELYGLTDH